MLGVPWVQYDRLVAVRRYHSRRPHTFNRRAELGVVLMYSSFLLILLGSLLLITLVRPTTILPLLQLRSSSS